MPDAVWWTGDAREGIADLGEDSIGAVVTSPPYWSKSGYGVEGELGVGDLDNYVADLAAILSPLKTALVAEGSLWLNLGDTANKSGGSGGDYNVGGSRNGRHPYRQGKTTLDGSQWCDVPGRVVRALQDDGWMLRAHIVWNKMRAKREDLGHVRRPGSCWESIFFMVPTRFNQAKLSYAFDHTKMTESGNVWSFPPRHHPLHPAVFPAELPKRCLEPLVDLVDVGPILDPFAGVGTTVGVAVEMGFNAMGFDLDPANEKLAMLTVPGLEYL